MLKTPKISSYGKKITAVRGDAKRPWGVDPKADFPGAVAFSVPAGFAGERLYAKLAAYLAGQQGDNAVDADAFAALAEPGRGPDTAALVAHAAAFASAVPFSRKTVKPETPNFFVSATGENAAAVREAKAVADAVTLERALQDAPSDVLPPDAFVARVKRAFAGVSGAKIAVLDEKALAKKGMGLLLGVNRGSKRGARLLTVAYTGAPGAAKRLAYVGKGICFDSGGMDLKPRPHMRHMKHDMAGAATVCAAVLALAKNGVRANVTAVAPLTENLLSNAALRPDDILRAYDGTTVEVENTDAEGRLVLGDAIAYAAKDLRADKIFTVATLTGTVLYALGGTFTGCWATDDAAWEELSAAADAAGEAVWRMPLHEDYDAVLESKLADVLSCVNRAGPDSSWAAAFLARFRGKAPLVHLDVAGTADRDGSSRGVMVRTLYAQAKAAFGQNRAAKLK